MAVSSLKYVALTAFRPVPMVALDEYTYCQRYPGTFRGRKVLHVIYLDPRDLEQTGRRCMQLTGAIEPAICKVHCRKILCLGTLCMSGETPRKGRGS